LQGGGFSPGGGQGMKEERQKGKAWQARGGMDGCVVRADGGSDSTLRCREHVIAPVNLRLSSGQATHASRGCVQAHATIALEVAASRDGGRAESQVKWSILGPAMRRCADTSRIDESMSRGVRCALSNCILSRRHSGPLGQCRRGCGRWFMVRAVDVPGSSDGREGLG